MSDRFDFEQQIMSCWNVVEDIKAVYELSDLRKYSEDEMANLLLGLQSLYQIKFEKLMDMFENGVRDGRFR